MGRLEAKIIHQLNKQGFDGFPTLYNLHYENKDKSAVNVVTDLIGSSLSQFVQKKELNLAQVLNLGI